MPASTQLPTNPTTIGMLTALLSGPTEINLWHGVADQARERSANLLCFSGGIPHWPAQYEAQKNILFNFAGRTNVDGLLIWANILSHTLDRSSLEAFCRRYAPLPMICMGMLLPSIPSIRIDMRAGMRKLLAHLIEDHGRRRIAFIRGLQVSQDAEDRYQAYSETLEEYNLPFDAGLVVPGDFRRTSGTEAVINLVDIQHKRFDALVSANDNMAIGAMKALQARGMLIPDDVIVAGFDDIEETRAVIPSITTLRTPWHALGSHSVDLILAQLAGEQVPEQIILETELVLRQSCGCQPFAAKTSLPLVSNSTFFTPADRMREITGALTAQASQYGLPETWADELLTEFIADVEEARDRLPSFIQSLNRVLASIPSGAPIIEWHAVLDTIRSHLPSLFLTEPSIIRAHELLENGYALIGETANRQQLSRRLEAENRTDRLNRIVQTMSTTYDMQTLMNLLASELPGLGIQSCFLSLYDEKGDHPAWSRLILACVDADRLTLDAAGIRFPTDQLVPHKLLPQQRIFAFDVEALYFQKEQIGFVLFEIGPRDGEVYTALRGHLSSALKSAELVQATLKAQEKAVKADQLKTHLLANVSHELRTPINIIMGLSQIALSSPNPYGIELPERLAKDLEHISDSGEHLVRLINDLLDMSRAEIGELDLNFEPVMPRTLLGETYETYRNTSPSKQKTIAFVLDIPEHLPMLYADPVRLRQVLLNLLSNAFKFTQQGQIVLGAEVQLPHIHIWVSDSGTGIAADLQERIFTPFVKADPPMQRGSGIGLGLSITRRLVALHGGSITLDSRPGQGSTFHVYIPLPGISTAAARMDNPNAASQALLWISSQPTPAAPILEFCQKNGLEPRRLGRLEEIEPVLQQHTPAALAWDLDNARPGDWAIIQKLRTYPQYCQLPLLLYQAVAPQELSAAHRVTNVLLKPAGRQTLQHILDLLPQSVQQGEIWIVDDDPQALKYYQAAISETLPEFLVREVPGGKQALSLLAEFTPDLVLLDLGMPEVDGFQVLEALRSNARTAWIPVIILTGKMLSYEDIQRLDHPKVLLQTKGILTQQESISEVERALVSADALPQSTSLLAKQIIAFIQQNYTRAFSLKELAETVGLSRSYLSRIFKLDTGISLWDYLNRYRIQKAKALLMLSSESITQIAADVGYEDVGYFGRVFRDIAGCSPSSYKQQAQASGRIC